MKKRSALVMALRELPEEHKLLPSGIRGIIAKIRNEDGKGLRRDLRLPYGQAQEVVRQYLSMRERLAMCLSDFDRARFGVGRQRFGRVAQLRVSRKAAKAALEQAKPKVSDKWQKVLDEANKGGSK